MGMGSVPARPPRVFFGVMVGECHQYSWYLDSNMLEDRLPEDSLDWVWLGIPLRRKNMRIFNHNLAITKGNQETIDEMFF